MVAFFETLIFWRVSGAAPAKLGKRGVVRAVAIRQSSDLFGQPLGAYWLRRVSQRVQDRPGAFAIGGQSPVSSTRLRPASSSCALHVLPSSTEGKNALFSGRYRRLALPDVGHFPMREAPEEVAAVVIEHFTAR